jgi:hypothetical protein
LEARLDLATPGPRRCLHIIHADLDADTLGGISQAQPA